MNEKNLIKLFLYILESTSFEFGPSGGMIWFLIPENRQVETKADVLTFGLMTTKDNAVVLRIESATTSDYIQLEIVSLSG